MASRQESFVAPSEGSYGLSSANPIDTLAAPATNMVAPDKLEPSPPLMAQ